MGDDYTITYTAGATVGGIISDDYTMPTPTFTVGDTELEDQVTISLGDFESKTWPSEDKVLTMIEQYPALKIQYEKFLEVYNLVKDDYSNALDE